MNEVATFALTTHSAEQTRLLGAALARAVLHAPIGQPVIVALNGELGAGKTTFVAGFLHALGVTGSVRSPTYTLVEPYELGERTVFHLDLYRLANPADLEALALRDLLSPGAVLLVEWAERGKRALPTPDLVVTLAYKEPSRDSDRTVDVGAWTPIGKGLAASLQGSADEELVSS